MFLEVFYFTGRDKSRDRALERLRALKTPLPKGFRFDRDEANAR